MEDKHLKDENMILYGVPQQFCWLLIGVLLGKACPAYPDTMIHHSTPAFKIIAPYAELTASISTFPRSSGWLIMFTERV